MCGRYDLDATAAELAARFGVPLRDVSVNVKLSTKVGWRPRYNIAPQQHNPVIVKGGGSEECRGDNQLVLMRWGLVPSWSKEAKVAYSTINARAETVANKPAFKKPLASQRCLVPATGYFEWVKGPGDVSVSQRGKRSEWNVQKQPYRIRLGSADVGKDGLDKVFAFAGLYDIWQGPDGEKLQTYTIVTTQANDVLSAIHSRMPVILPRDVEEIWLNGDNKDIEDLTSLLQPYPQEEMTAYPVSRLVNSPSNDGRRLIEPLRFVHLAA